MASTLCERRTLRSDGTEYRVWWSRAWLPPHCDRFYYRTEINGKIGWSTENWILSMGLCAGVEYRDVPN